MIDKLEEKAHELELKIATSALLTALFPELDRKMPGRYHFLGSIIRQRSSLLQALLDGNKARIQSEWSQVLRLYQADVRFLHALTIMYWESALAKYTQQEEADQDWVISTALWILLLSSDEFLDSFSQERWTNEQGERLPLDEKQQKGLVDDALETVLSLHSTYGKQSFTAGRYEQTKAHVRCLDMCRGKGKQLLSLLRTYGIPFGLSQDEQRLEGITERASKEIDEWCVGLVAEAEKETNDPDAIKQLPQGIRKNYAGGIRILDSFIALHIPIVRVLSACLEWYNEWCYDVYVLKDTPQLKKLVASARVVADQLIPLCMKEQAYTKENQRLSQHFLLRGFALESFKEAIPQYQEALAWNPANVNAAELLMEAEEIAPEEENIRLLKLAEEAFEKEQYDQAIGVASRVPSSSRLSKQATALLAGAYFQRGIKVANQGNHLKGEEDLRKALSLVDADEGRKIIAEQLSALLMVRALTQAKASQQRGEPIRDIASLRRLLEEAVRLDPNNTQARTNLNVLNNALR